MWPYFGTKYKLAPKYPEPKFDKIIEPFAGAGQYSLLHFEKDVTLVDSYDLIINLWKWLQKCSTNDILSLPDIEFGKTLEDYTFDCAEAKNLVGFIIGMGSSSPRNKASAWSTYLRPNRQPMHKKRIAGNLYKIRHWKFIHGDYQCLANIDATWFIDPPYQTGGTQYKHSTIDYAGLSDWSKSRKGQVIVCENDKADWMDFTFLSDLHGVKHHTKEVVYLQG